ncbi:MAG: YceI family protein [Rhodanobacter sp.]
MASAASVDYGTNYHIDSAHSQAAFGVHLFWIHEISGRFTQITGLMRAGPAPATVIVDATITVDSVAVDSQITRRWLLSREFFDATRYPTVRFISDPFPLSALDSGGDLPGLLNLRGITAPVHFTLKPMYCPPTVSPSICRVVLSGHLQRSDFGMISHRAAVSDQVELKLDIALQVTRHQS